jgi:hypothetical protein
MAPIKFEEQLKDKLEKRTLSPSSESWAKLSQRLDAEDKKSKNPLFWWLGIAAGIIIMIAVSIQFFKTADTEKVMPQIVDEPIKSNQIDSKQSKEVELQQIESPTNELAGQTIENEYKEETKIYDDAPNILDYKKTTDNAPASKTNVADNTTIKDEVSKLGKTTVISKELPIITDESMLKESVAYALKKLKSTETTAADREVDSLLKLASKELFKDKLQKETTKTVDAEALLMSVEDEMGQSFRSKVFEALKDSFETVKTAVAERNN